MDEQDSECKFVTSHFRLSMDKEESGFHFGIHEILNIDVSPSLDAKFSQSSNFKRMYLPVSRGNINQLIKNPLDGSLSSRGVTLYSAALQAHNQNIQNIRSPPGYYLLLLCRVIVASTLPQVFPSPKQRGTPFSFYETNNTLQITNKESILPEFIIKYGVQDPFSVLLESKMKIDKYSILDNLEVQTENEFMKYKVSLWDKLQPDILEEIRRNEANLQKLKSELLTVKRKIREEKNAQEEFFHNIRNR